MALRIGAVLLLSAAAILGMAMPVAASAESAVGRWQSERPALVLDISACAEGYCGVQVNADGSCDRRVLTFAALSEMFPLTVPAVEPPGRLQLATHPAPMEARVSLAPGRAESPPRIIIYASERAGPAMAMRRFFPFQAVLARIGDAACAPAVS